MSLCAHISALCEGVLKNFQSSQEALENILMFGHEVRFWEAGQSKNFSTHTLIWMWISYNLACISVYLLIKSDANKRFLLFHSISYIRLKYFVWFWLRYPLISFSLCLWIFCQQNIYNLKPVFNHRRGKQSLGQSITHVCVCVSVCVCMYVLCLSCPASSSSVCLPFSSPFGYCFFYSFS